MRTIPITLWQWTVRQAKDLEIQGLVLASLVIIGSLSVGASIRVAVDWLTHEQRVVPSTVPVIVERVRPVLIEAPKVVRQGVIPMALDGMIFDGLDFRPLPISSPFLAYIELPEPQQAQEPSASEPRSAREGRRGRAPYVAGQIGKPFRPLENGL